MHIHTCMRCLCLRSCLPSSVVLNCKHMSFHMSILGLEPQPQKKTKQPQVNIPPSLLLENREECLLGLWKPGPTSSRTNKLSTAHRV